jgi:MIP family channel proteins
MNPKTLRPLTAECIGTALFVFLGAGSVVMNVPSGLGTIGIALAHGVALAIIVSATMNISGGHINPAVTAAVWVARKIDGRTAGLYVVAQLIGAVLGALLVNAVLPHAAVRAMSVGTPAVATSVTFAQAVWIEAVLTFFLVSAVLGTVVSSESPRIGGFGVGLALFVDILLGGPLTGAAMNPARAFGPALVAWDWHGQAIFWIGPLVGALVAAAVWRWVLLPRDPTNI